MDGTSGFFEGLRKYWQVIFMGFKMGSRPLMDNNDNDSACGRIY